MSSELRHVHELFAHGHLFLLLFARLVHFGRRTRSKDELGRDCAKRSGCRDHKVRVAVKSLRSWLGRTADASSRGDCGAPFRDLKRLICDSFYYPF